MAGGAQLRPALLMLLAAGPALAATDPPPLARLSHDAAIAGVLKQLRDHSPFGLIEIDNVQIVDPADLTVTPDSTIIVQKDRIVWTGKTAELPKVAAQLTHIDGRGRRYASVARPPSADQR